MGDDDLPTIVEIARRADELEQLRFMAMDPGLFITPGDDGSFDAFFDRYVVPAIEADSRGRASQRAYVHS